MTHKMGYVCILGAPNAGKSTLTNALTGSKISIVTYKPQTTRTRVIGIVTEGDSQMALIDTPGIFEPKRRLDRAMVNAAWSAMGESDQIVLLVDAGRKNPLADVRAIIDHIKQSNKKCALVLNKIDTIEKPLLLKLAEQFNAEGIFSDIFMISALKGSGVNDLKKFLLNKMPAGHWMYAEDQLSDMPERLLAAEIVREQVFLKLKEELPYNMTVETEQWESFDNGSVKISMVIFVAREGHKPMVLGHGGQMIKRIGSAARGQLEKIMDCRVHLSLFVKVRENWQDDPERYAPWGLEFKS